MFSVAAEDILPALNVLHSPVPAPTHAGTGVGIQRRPLIVYHRGDRDTLSFVYMLLLPLVCHD